MRPSYIVDTEKLQSTKEILTGIPIEVSYVYTLDGRVYLGIIQPSGPEAVDIMFKNKLHLEVWANLWRGRKWHYSAIIGLEAD